MGKAARNEHIKLRAAFYNNIAIGLTMGGIFIPVLSAYKPENFQPFTLIRLYFGVKYNQ
jgi:hypothetical protein